MLNFTKKFIVILIYIIPTKLQSQGIDVDSLFISDSKAREFIESLYPQDLESIPDWDSIWVYKRLSWKNLRMRFYKGEHASNTKPCIVFFYGGGWVRKAPNQHQRYAYYFKQMGYNVIGVEYRVMGDSSVVTPYDALEDTKSAFRYIRENWKSLEVDRSKIIGVGMSAGGHLVSAASFLQGFENTSEDLSISSSPNALILQNAVFDLSPDGFVWGNTYFGENWKLFSPLHHIENCNSIPSIVLSGTNDEIAPFKSMIRWDSVYKSLDCNNTLYRFVGRRHGFANFATKHSGENHRDFYFNIYLINKFLVENDFCLQDNTHFSTNLCLGDSISVAGQTFFMEGKYQILLQNQAGCDSVVNLDLQILPNDTIPFSTSFCLGDSISVAGQTFFMEGKYQILLQNQAGCDSVVNLSITKCDLNGISINTPKTTIFPSPADQQVNIVSNQEIVEISIFSIEGKNEERLLFNNYNVEDALEIDISSYRNGVKLITIVYKSGYTSRHIILKN